MDAGNNANNSDVLDARAPTWDAAPETSGAFASRLAPETIVLSRLEFGKFCATPNGAVEKEGGTAEHRVLGKSPDFPPLVSGYCNPSSIRAVGSEGELTPADCIHATLLVPCITQTQVQPIFCRIRQRPEDGEGGTERKYKLARYLVSSNERAHPLLLFEAMESMPMLGLTRAQVAQLPPLVSQVRLVKPNSVARAFAKQAVMYALSGIPICCVDVSSESQFFQCVSALWFLLPPSLRPFLSAGWGVGSSILGRMTVTYGESRNPACAVFSLEELTWSPPTKLRVLDSEGTTELIDYYDERRRPGEDFWRLFYTEADATGFLSFEEAAGQNKLACIAELPETTIEGIRDWHDANLVRTFRTPGLKAHDHCRLTELSDWLQRGLSGENNRVSINASNFIYQKTRVVAFDEILNALANPEQQERGELALWETLEVDVSPTFSLLLKNNERPGRFRAQLVSAIRQNDELRALKSLFQAAHAGEADNLIPKAQEVLTSLLDRSIQLGGPEILGLHSTLITLAQLPETYRNWVIANRLNLVKLSAQDSGELDQQMAMQVADLSNDNDILTMLALNANGQPSERDLRVISELSEADKEKFVWLLAARWAEVDGDVAARREALYPWLVALKPEDSSEPLWRLALKEPLTGSADHIALAREVENGWLPISLRERVAALVLERWPRFSAQVNSNTAAWSGILHLFPAELEKVLLCSSLQAQPRQVGPVITEAAAKCWPEPIELNRLIAHWVNFDFAGFGPMLWRWATSDPGPLAPVGASGLVYRMSQLRWPVGGNLSWADIKSAIALARAARKTTFFFENREELWRKANAGWQAIIMLDLLPQADLTPTLAQLNSLIPHREILRRHLDETATSGRKKKFRLAALNFQELDYKDDHLLWTDELTETNLWAIFRRVPLRKQPPGSLDKAIRSFSEGVEAERVLDARARMCLEYLGNYLATDVFELALSKVMLEGLVPLLSKGGWNREGIEHVVKSARKELTANEGGGFLGLIFTGTRNHRRTPISPSGLDELLLAVVSNYSSDRSLWEDLKRAFNR